MAGAITHHEVLEAANAGCQDQGDALEETSCQYLPEKVFLGLNRISSSSLPSPDLHVSPGGRKHDSLFLGSVYMSIPWERTRRTNLFWSLECGRLDLVNINLKMAMNEFLFFQDQKDALMRASFRA